MSSAPNTVWAALIQALPEHLREPRARFVVRVILLALLSTLLAAVLSPSDIGRVMSNIFAGQMLLLLLAFYKGLSERRVVYIGASVGMAYLFAMSLTEGHIYSSSLAWVPLIPLAIFYVVNPQAGRVWMLLAALSQVLMAAVAWTWAQQLPFWQGPELPFLSVIDCVLATITLFFVPYFYQNQLDMHLQEIQQRQNDLQAKQVELEYMLQMREHFIASVSHELRTPMNAILGLNSVLLARVQDKPQAHKVLEYTRQSADHLMTVINDVLDYSQFSTGRLRPNPETFALRETVRAAFEMFQPRVESTRLRYSCEIAADVPEWVQTDRHRLMQVLVNLLGNAIKFTHQGSVLLRVDMKDGDIEFCVQDTGIGIATEQQQRIFERFGQADASIQSQYGGSGLGLTISQRLVQMLGGQLQLESHEGAGSCFWFRLPLKGVPAPVPTEPQGGQMQTGTRQAQRFLVVDDHPVNRLLVRQLLLRHWPQAEVLEVPDGAQALQALESGPVFDLVLMDMVMPVVDGIEATAAMRASPRRDIRHTPVLGLTANVSQEDLRRFEQAGLQGLLLKPFETDRFRVEVQRLLHSPSVREASA